MKALGTSDFWELTRGRILRDETKNFVPAIHAATLIGREPERYGFTASQTEPLAYEAVPVPSGLALSRVAVLAGVGVEVLCELNPELRLKQTPPGGPYLLKFPVGASERFVEAQERAARTAARDGRPRAPGGQAGDPCRPAERNRGRDRQALRHLGRRAHALERARRGRADPPGRPAPDRLGRLGRLASAAG